MFPSRLSSIEKFIGDALDFSSATMEEENARLKDKIKELEATLMPPPIMASSIAMIQLEIFFQETLGSSARVKGISNLIISTRHFVKENIKKRMSLILELWDMEKVFPLSV